MRRALALPVLRCACGDEYVAGPHPAYRCPACVRKLLANAERRRSARNARMAARRALRARA